MARLPTYHSCLVQPVLAGVVLSIQFILEMQKKEGLGGKRVAWLVFGTSVGALVAMKPEMICGTIVIRAALFAAGIVGGKCCSITQYLRL